ncbi:MAG: hypothetical protein K0R34_2881 [Herbinix sp.]|nr:hypothetical protein [Herbinix sp.]
MNSKELLEQAEQRIAEVESIKILVSNVNALTMIISEVQKPQNDICIGELMEETNISGSIGFELNLRLKTAIATNLEYFLSEKNKELEKLLGIRKPATINKEFEKAVQEMEQSAKKPDPVTEKLSSILQKESDKIESKPVEAEPSLDKYPAQKNTRKKLPEGMTDEAVYHLLMVDGKKPKEIAEHYGLKSSQVSNFIFQHDIKNYAKRKKTTPANEKPAKQPEETERPSQS